MQGHLSRLLRAAAWGSSLAVLAGCGGNTDTGGGSGGSAGNSSGGSSGSGGQVDAGMDARADSGFDAGNLQPYPTELTCFGPEYDGGYYGQCCEQVVCGTPSAGTCPDPADVTYTEFPGLPPGSGSCECGERSGPHAPREAGEGACCYVVGGIACEGRPLLVDGTARHAPVVSRRDWSWV
ncbi:MAG: hypothetical protein H6718_14550 [Polyangiaceae bacterium]|nr:hypothetical protein [Myxococcales bacterium]MCB9586617.1 hypothetical protein [Polyangiaceae bacterium]MCB9606124.1 hypothetical protein [Polyangiaceae bacterium]